MIFHISTLSVAKIINYENSCFERNLGINYIDYGEIHSHSNSSLCKNIYNFHGLKGSDFHHLYEILGMFAIMKASMTRNQEERKKELAHMKLKANI